MLPCLEHSRLGLGENTTLSLKSLNIFPRMFFNVKLILKVDLFSSIFGSEDSLLTERQKNRKTEKQKNKKNIFGALIYAPNMPNMVFGAHI